MSIKFSAKPIAFAVALIATGGLLSACGGGSSDGPRIQVSPANAYLLTSKNRIIGVDLDDTEFARSGSPFGPDGFGVATNTVSFDASNTNNGYSANALDIGEDILDIDYRNSEGLLYALTRINTGTSIEGRIIIVDPISGFIARRGTLAPDASDTSNAYTALSSTASYAIDFDPDANQLRIIGSDKSNLQVAITPNADATAATPTTPSAIVTTEAAISCAPACAAGAAFTDERGNTPPARLFAIDTNNTYALNADAGTVSATRPLGIAGISSVNGFDINPSNNQGVAIFTVGSGQPSVYLVNSSAAGTSNAASSLTSLPSLPSGESYTGLSLVTAANP